MKIRHNETKLKRIVYPSDKVEETLAEEMQLLEASKTFRVYHNISRPNALRSHRLEPQSFNWYGIGLDKSYRMIVKPLAEGLDKMGAEEVEIIEYVYDYHKKKLRH